MASIADHYVGGKLKYRVRWRNPQGQSRSKVFARHAEATAFKKSIEADLTRNEYVAPTRRSVAEAVSDWLSNGVNAEEAASVRNYRSISKYVTEPTWPGSTQLRTHHIGNVRLTDLGSKHIEPWLAEIGRQRSQSTVNKALTILHQTLRREVRFGNIRANPLDGITDDLPHSKVKSDDKIALTREECRELIRGAEKFEQDTGTDVPVALIFELLATTGLRINEALALVGRNLNVVRGTVTVERSLKVNGERGKVKTPASARTVQITRSLAERLAELVTAPEGFLFRAEKGGPVLYRNFYSRTFRAVVESALPDKAHQIATHTFRRSHATHLVEDGMNPKKIQARLGHENVSMTLDLYAKVHGEFSSDEVESFDLFGTELRVAS